MSINMANVKKIRIPGSLYKKKIYLTNSSVVYKGTSTPCPVELTLYSKTTSTPTITASNLYDVLGICGYTMASNSRYYLTVDNPYEFTYNNGTYDCVYASFQSQSATYPLVVWFSVPGATSVNVWQNWTITEDSWQEVGPVSTFTYEYKQYINSAAGSYTNFTVSNNEYGTEYIANYCIDGVSYPDVTIVSVSGDSYTLSNQEVITITAEHPSVIETGKKVKKIENLNGDVLWPNKTLQGYHIKQGNYYINHGTNYYVTNATTASTIWYIDSDNRIYCLDGDTKWYLQAQTSGTTHTVYVDTQEGSGYVWLYKDGNYITGTIDSTTYYLYRYGTGNQGVRMRTTATTITFEQAS